MAKPSRVTSFRAFGRASVPWLAAIAWLAGCGSFDDDKVLGTQPAAGSGGSASGGQGSGAGSQGGTSAQGGQGGSHSGGHHTGGSPGAGAGGTASGGQAGTAGSNAAGNNAAGSNTAGTSAAGHDHGEMGGMACSTSGSGGAPSGVAGSYASIPSNFDPNEWLEDVGIPPSGDPDVVGAFRFICNASHLGYDDPIVYPGQPCKSHLHQFFGNTLTNAHSTYESLRTSGDSTCNNKLNRSAYWIPAMMNGKGKVVRPDYVSVYYKRFPKDSSWCTKVAKECRDLPRGLRFVFGYDPAKPEVHTSGYFNCDGPGAKPDHYPDIPTAAANCPLGAKLGAVISAPSCWNGELDSPDHRSHLTDGIGDPNDGISKCPSTHPYIIPTLTLGVWYSVDEDLDHSGTWTPGMETWSLSSDVMASGEKPGFTLHADWIGAWDDDVMQMWTDNCINKLLSCSGGVLGNGKMLKMYPGFSWTADPHTVDPPM